MCLSPFPSVWASLHFDILLWGFWYASYSWVRRNKVGKDNRGLNLLMVKKQKMLCCPQPPTPPKTLTTGKHPIFVRLGIFWEKKVVNALKFCTFGCFKNIFSNWPTQIFSNSTWGQHNNFLLLAWWGKGEIWTVWYPVTSLGCSQQTYIGLLAIIS